jgi:hypothetical protein
MMVGVMKRFGLNRYRENDLILLGRWREAA